MKYKNLIPILLISMITLVGCSKSTETKNTATPTTKTVTEKKKKIDGERNFGNSINNFSRKLQVAEYNDEFYYSKENSPGLYKMSLDCKNATKLNDDKARYINVYKDHIYYINTDNFELVSVELDGAKNKQIITKDVVQALVKDDKLIYMVMGKELTGRFIGYRELKMVVLNLKTNTEEKRIYAGYGRSHIIDEETYLGFSTSIENYIFNNDKKVFPDVDSSIKPIIGLVGATDKFTVATVSEWNKTFNGETYAIGKDGSYTAIAPKGIETKILTSNTLYYFEGSNFMKCNLKDFSKETVMQNLPYNGELFEFDNIIYGTKGDSLTPVYDIKNTKVIDSFIKYSKDIDKN